MPIISKIPPRRPFAVVVEITSTHHFTTDARTPEEAEAIVEEWVEDGETGQTSTLGEIRILDTYAVENPDKLDDFLSDV